ncbi:MAG TPA: transglutaminase domain-containing protein [Burkholderiales bacterium]
MDRRTFLKTGVVTSCAAAWRRAASAQQDATAASTRDWRRFEVTSRIEILKPEGVTQVWLPLPCVDAPGWVRNHGDSWSGNGDSVQVFREERFGARMLHARWHTAETPPVIEVVSRISTRDRTTDFSRPSRPDGLEPQSRALYTAGSELIPVDGIVRHTAERIVRTAGTDLDKARAIYDWIVDNTSRNPKTRGCGLGNIRFMLESGDLSGKCADINSLYVGLCRSIGIPARDVYGVRVADSRWGFKSLGRSADITKAQHCRAEVWLADYGWVAIDPADVRKVLLEEKPGLTLDDTLVRQARTRLFGGWEMNWMPYNVAHDIALPDADGPPIPFLMYPQAQTGGRKRDSLDPENFRYALTSREITA